MAFRLIIITLFVALIYYSVAITRKNTELNLTLEQRDAQLMQYIDKVKQMQDISDKQSAKLSEVNAEIDKLESDLRDRSKRLYVKTVCPRTEDKTTSVDDGRSAELARDAEQNYLRLRRQLETLEAQYLGLRDYVTNVCSN